MTMMTSVAGNGAQGYDGDNGPATQALMDNPFHIDLDLRILDLATTLTTTLRGTAT